MPKVFCVFSLMLMSFLMVLELTACGDEKPANTPTPSPTALPTTQLAPVKVATPVPVASIPPTADPTAFPGKDGVCITLSALAMASLKDVQARFGLEKALASQQVAMKNFKPDARPWEASLSCSEGRLAWSVNWTSDKDKLSWVFTSFVDTTPAMVETQIKQGLATYPEEHSAELFTLETQAYIGLDKVGAALLQNSYKGDLKVFSVTLAVIPAQSQYRLVFEPSPAQTSVNVDAVSGKVNA